MPNSDASTDAWSLVDFTVDEDEAELLADLLWSMGVVAIEEIDSPDGAVTLRTSMGENPRPALATVSSEFPEARIGRVEVARSVADTWREHATPTHVVDDVWLVPAWTEPPPGSRAILVEPLDTFGLGNHPTTVLALRLALAHCDLSDTLFDLGCGSGVLAVAATKLRGTECCVYDIADSARRAVAINAELNEVAMPEWVEMRPASPQRTVLANILAPVLVELAATVIGTCVHGGTIVLSGMRSEQVARVLGSYEGTTEIAREELDGWTAVVLRRD